MTEKTSEVPFLAPLCETTEHVVRPSDKIRSYNDNGKNYVASAINTKNSHHNLAHDATPIDPLSLKVVKKKKVRSSSYR